MSLGIRLLEEQLKKARSDLNEWLEAAARADSRAEDTRAHIERIEAEIQALKEFHDKQKSSQDIDSKPEETTQAHSG
jgi:predicted  nucleic acid-binding Zn-ribbon protein